VAITVARSVSQSNTETTLVRDVSKDMVLLEPDQAALLVLTTAAGKRKQPAKAHKIEWPEDQEVGLWGSVSNGTTDYSSVATNVFVGDVTIFAVADLVAIPKAASSSAAEEVARITAISGTTNGTLTITRNIGGAGADTIGATNSLRILGPAFAEDAAPGAVRSTTKVMKVSYIQIFKDAQKITDSADAVEQYGAPEGERAYQQFKLMQKHRNGIEAALLWGRASESLASPSSVWTTMGLKSRIAANVTDISTTFSVAKMNSISESAFRYGQPEKLAVCAPVFVSAFNSFGQGKLQMSTGEKVFGVNITKVITPHGTLNLARNWRMEAGVTGAAGFNDEMYIIDLPSIKTRVLKGFDTKLYQDIVKDGATQKVDEIRTYMGFEIHHESRHARAFNCSAYS
jgi:hypothetical protein